MNEEKEIIKRLSDIFNSEFKYLYFGSLISSDNVVDINSCENAIKNIKFIIEHISEFDIDDDSRTEIHKFMLNGLDIVKQDLEYFKKQEHNNKNT